MLHGWRELGIGLQDTDGEGRAVIKGELTRAGMMNRVRNRLGKRVAGGTLLGPTWDRPAPPVGDNPTATRCQYLQGILN